MSATIKIANAPPRPAKVVPAKLPRVYTYDHCPFCVRVRLGLGIKNVKHEIVFMANDDIKTPTDLVGKKIAPIFEEFPGGSSEGKISKESMDIIKAVDSNPEYGPTGAIKESTGRDDIGAWKKSVQNTLRLLHRPRYMRASLPEFQQADSRDYFVFGHPVPNAPTGMDKAAWKELPREVQWAEYEKALEKTDEVMPELNNALQELEKLIESPLGVSFDTGGGITYDDIDLWSRLRSVTLVEGAKFGPKTRDYLEYFSDVGDIPLYFPTAM